MRASASVVWFGLGVLVGTNASAAEYSDAAEPGPDIELLEYLGDLVEEKGRWVGPDDMKGATDERDWSIVLDEDAVHPDATNWQQR